MLIPLFCADKLALVGGLIHSMVPGSVPAVGTILIDHGQIEAIGPEVVLPKEGVKKIDLAGKHVLPGLIDGMVNFDGDHDRLYLSCGVTLVREIGADVTTMVAERDTYQRERNPGPSLWIAGAIFDGYPPSTSNAVVATTPEEAVDKGSRFIDPEGAIKVDYLSIFPGLPVKPWHALIELGHKQQRPVQVWGPLPKGVTLDAALEAGQDGVFHLDSLLPAGKDWLSITDAEIAAIAQRVGQTKLMITPTLAGYAQRLVLPADDPPELKYLGPIQVAQWIADATQRATMYAKDPELRAKGAAAFAHQAALAKALYAKHVVLVPGSACGQIPWMLPGEALLNELSLLVSQAGIPQAEVLRLATQGSARAIGASAMHGTLEPGKSADLVVTSGDPEQDLKLLRRPDYVVLRGRVLPASELESLRADLAARQKTQQEHAFKPLELAPPKVPAGELVLSGMVEEKFGGVRLSGERYAVVRSLDHALVYCGHMLTFGTATIGDTEVELSQKIADNTLVEFDLSVTTGKGQRVVTLKGVTVAGRLKIEKRLNGVFQQNIPVKERVAFLEVASVTSDLILGQHVQPGTFKALMLQDFEPAVGNWELAVDPADGQHLLRSPVGERAVSFAPDGTLLVSQRASGHGKVAITSVEAKAEGAGLPVAKKQNPPKDPAPAHDAAAPKDPKALK